MKNFYLALDLKNDPILIAEYEKLHENIWPEITASIKEAGVLSMEIYRTGTRLFMVMVTNENFSFETKHKLDTANSKVQEWETLMWQYQQAIPTALPGEKWVLMNKIFDLKK